MCHAQTSYRRYSAFLLDLWADMGHTDGHTDDKQLGVNGGLSESGSNNNSHEARMLHARNASAVDGSLVIILQRDADPHCV